MLHEHTEADALHGSTDEPTLGDFSVHTGILRYGQAVLRSFMQLWLQMRMTISLRPECLPEL